MRKSVSELMPYLKNISRNSQQLHDVIWAEFEEDLQIPKATDENVRIIIKLHGEIDDALRNLQEKAQKIKTCWELLESAIKKAENDDLPF